MSDCISADGVDLEVGMVVAHHYDEWQDAGEIMFIHNRDELSIVHAMSALTKDVSAYPCDCWYATELGLVQNKIYELEHAILRYEREIKRLEELRRKRIVRRAALTADAGEMK
jgi:hypothetical protein